MKIAYFDVFAGAAGDMILGALLDAAPAEAHLEAWLRGQLEALRLPGWRLSIERQERGHIMGTRALVEMVGQPPARTFYDIRLMLEAADLEDEVKRLSLETFGRLAAAEGRIHGVEHDLVHFHEVGAVDSIIDIVGAAACFAGLGLKAAFASAIPLGGGLVECRHGVLPVPAPATIELLKDVPVRPGPIEQELTTPTGAALLTTFCGRNFGQMPPLIPQAVGYGVGSRDLGSLPNLLRVIIGQAQTGEAAFDEVALLETNIDDMNPQLYGDLMERLFAAGALDVWLAPVQMKKDRPGTLVAVLCRPGGEEACARVLFRESTTLGVRFSRRTRLVCAREAAWVEAGPLGRVAVKLARDPWGGLRAAPEMESVREAARRVGMALPEAYRVASEACTRLLAERGGEPPLAGSAPLGA